MAEKIFCEEQIKPELSEDTLAHYGVIGMKWGIRKDPEKAYARASDKAAKLKKKAGIKNQKRVQKKSKKAARATKKYIRSLDNPFASDKKVYKRAVAKDRAQYKMDKAISRSAKASKRENKWNEAMAKAFLKEAKHIERTTKEDNVFKDERFAKLVKAYEPISRNTTSEQRVLINPDNFKITNSKTGTVRNGSGEMIEDKKKRKSSK